MAILEVYTATLGWVADRVRPVSPAEFALPTPCAEWSVAQLLTHMVVTTTKYTAIASGVQATSRNDPVSGAEFDELVQRARDAWSGAGVLTQEYPYAFLGRAQGHRILGIHLADLLVHGWDLARATGQDDTMDEDCARFALAVHQREFTGSRRGAYFGPRLSVPCGAGPQRQLLARAGRDYTWAPNDAPIGC